MTIWFALFILILIVSFVLAYLSMKDYQELPAKSAGFGIFLIQNPHNFTNAIMKTLYSEVSKRKTVITLERLFKGSKSALIITGPKQILERYNGVLNLLELEDFTNIDENLIETWELGVKSDIQRPLHIDDIFSDIPQFETDEQFWWQLTLQTSPLERNSVVGFLKWLVLGKKSKELLFQSQIRSVLYAPNPDRRVKLADKLESLGEGILIKIPRPITSGQILKNYKLRSITPADPHLLNLSTDEVLAILGKTN